MTTTEAPELTGSNTEGKHLGLALASSRAPSS